MSTATTIKRSTTAEYPTRYAAFDRDSEMVVYEGDFHDPLELAVYSHGVANAEYPHLTDGVYCEVRKFPSASARKGAWSLPRVRVEVHATRPNASREQRSWGETFTASLGSTDGAVVPSADLEKAIGMAERFIAEAEAFIREGA